jgi:hypothetical protein
VAQPRGGASAALEPDALVVDEPRRADARGDEHAHALGSVAVGAPADGMSIVPTRRADRAGASSMLKLIESDSISVSDAARGDMTSA